MPPGNLNKLATMPRNYYAARNHQTSPPKVWSILFALHLEVFRSHQKRFYIAYVLILKEKNLNNPCVGVASIQS